MIVAIGSDHAGFELKELIIKFLAEQKIEFVDCGTHSSESVDYPDYALKVAKTVLSDAAKLGIIVCGTGIGVSIVANKIKGIRAALCCSEFAAEMARKHNDANVLALGGRTTPPEIAYRIVKIFIDTEFLGGRHQTRVEKIHKLTNL
jgi:ribose 5-phosphate isomerase B